MAKKAPKISADNQQELARLLKDNQMEEAEEQAAEMVEEQGGTPVATSGKAAQTPSNLLALQKTVGNKAVQRLIKDAIQRNSAEGGTATAAKPSSSNAPGAAPEGDLVALPGATYEIKEEDGKLVAKMRDGKDDAEINLELQEDSGLWKDEKGRLYKLGDGSNAVGKGNKVMLSKE